MFQVYDVREMQRQLRMRRSQVVAVFAAGALFGLLSAQTGGWLSSASAQTLHAQPPLSCAGQPVARTTLQLDCGLRRS